MKLEFSQILTLFELIINLKMSNFEIYDLYWDILIMSHKVLLYHNLKSKLRHFGPSRVVVKCFVYSKGYFHIEMNILFEFFFNLFRQIMILFNTIIVCIVLQYQVSVQRSWKQNNQFETQHHKKMKQCLLIFVVLFYNEEVLCCPGSKKIDSSDSK